MLIIQKSSDKTRSLSPSHRVGRHGLFSPHWVLTSEFSGYSDFLCVIPTSLVLTWWIIGACFRAFMGHVTRLSLVWPADMRKVDRRLEDAIWDNSMSTNWSFFHSASTHTHTGRGMLMWTDASITLWVLSDKLH